MKTADTKALELIETWLASPCAHGVPQMTAILQCLIANALKEQDRDTRHKCAEAVMNCREVCETPNGEGAISPDDAHAACINVKSV